MIDLQPYITFDDDALLDISCIIATSEADWLEQAAQCVEAWPDEIDSWRSALLYLGDLSSSIQLHLDREDDPQLTPLLVRRLKLLCTAAVNIRWHRLRGRSA